MRFASTERNVPRYCRAVVRRRLVFGVVHEAGHLELDHLEALADRRPVQYGVPPRIDKLLADFFRDSEGRAFFHVGREKGIKHGDFRQWNMQRREDRRNTKQDACF